MKVFQEVVEDLKKDPKNNLLVWSLQTSKLLAGLDLQTFNLSMFTLVGVENINVIILSIRVLPSIFKLSLL